MINDMQEDPPCAARDAAGALYTMCSAMGLHTSSILSFGCLCGGAGLVAVAGVLCCCAAAMLQHSTPHFNKNVPSLMLL